MDFYNWPNKVEGDLNALDFYIVILECTFNVVCHVVYYTTEFCLKRALCSSSQKMIMILWQGKKIELEWNNWSLLLNRVFTSLYAVHEALFCTMIGGEKNWFNCLISQKMKYAKTLLSVSKYKKRSVSYIPILSLD